MYIIHYFGRQQHWFFECVRGQPRVTVSKAIDFPYIVLPYKAECYCSYDIVKPRTKAAARYDTAIKFCRIEIYFFSRPGPLERQEKKKDASGNVIREDMGLLLKRKLKEYFQKIGKPLSLKYIDPSYIIRSVPANSHDSSFCLALGQYAVHAGMSGRTNMVAGYWNQHFTHVPIALATMKRKKIDLQGFLWQMVLGTTGQECREKIEESRE